MVRRKVPTEVRSASDALAIALDRYELQAKDLANAARLDPADLSRYLSGGKDIGSRKLDRIIWALPESIRSEFLKLYGTLRPEEGAVGLGSVALLDDEALILDSLKRRIPYPVIEARNTRDARKALENPFVRVLVLDLLLAEGNYTGIEFAREVREKYPQLPIVVYSSYASDRQLWRQASEISLVDWLEKDEIGTQELIEFVIPRFMGGKVDNEECKTPAVALNGNLQACAS